MELIVVRPCGYFYGIYCCLLNTAKILRDHLSGNVVMSDSMSGKLARMFGKRHRPERAQGVDGKTMFDRLAHTWWDPDGFLQGIATLLNPVRSSYFGSVLKNHFDQRSGVKILDVGCGGGLLAEQLYSCRFNLYGLDISLPSVMCAKAHGADNGANIFYINASAETIPFCNGYFDAVVCADVLEHVEDWPQSVKEISRVLKPNGIFLFDTVNRTPFSWLVVTKLIQDWPLTRLVPKRGHIYEQLIRPDELKQVMKEHGVIERERSGLWTGANVIDILRVGFCLKFGNMTFPEAGRRLQLELSPNTWMSYIGYGQKLLDEK